jgi:GNAT superfamily N-acetyltransferase
VTTVPGDSAAFAADAGEIRIEECLPSGLDAFRLLRAFHAEQVGRYGFADPVELSPGEYAAPDGVFVIAYRDAAAVGCGGYRWFDRTAGVVEIKRLYVTLASRGQGVGHAVLSWLERHAVAAGARQAILETGVRNHTALSLFTSAGYRPVARYVEGRDPEINRAFARSLTGCD